MQNFLMLNLAICKVTARLLKVNNAPPPPPPPPPPPQQTTNNTNKIY
jgi:hypothetical protein